MTLIADKTAKRILVVDDVADNLFLVQLVLVNRGYEIITALGGKAAFTKIKLLNEKPNLVISDIMMPNMNGYDVIYCLRRHQDLHHIPVLLMTGDNDISCEIASRAGAVGLLYKPLDLEQLISKVELILMT